MLRAGTVSTVNAADRTVRVTFPDRDDMVSGDLPVIGPPAQVLPTEGQSVLIAYAGNGNQGFCVGIIPEVTGDE